jgi:sulfur-oxidizing protein SoxY
VSTLGRVNAQTAVPDPFPQLARAITGGAPIRNGRVTIDTPRLADNGHSVPITVRVESAMTAQDHVRRITLVSESNPRPLIATFHLTAKSGKAEIITRIRLNKTQRVMALAELSDGTFWSDRAEVIVTESACLEED